jgi:hypothetical protein
MRVYASQVHGTITLVPTGRELGVRVAFDPVQPTGAAAPEAIVVVVTRGHDVAHLKGSAATQQAGGTAMAAALPGAVAAGDVVGVRVLVADKPVFEARWQAPAAR